MERENELRAIQAEGFAKGFAKSFAAGFPIGSAEVKAVESAKLQVEWDEIATLEAQEVEEAA
jgi:hypothetical protein